MGKTPSPCFRWIWICIFATITGVVVSLGCLLLGLMVQRNATVDSASVAQFSRQAQQQGNLRDNVAVVFPENGEPHIITTTSSSSTWSGTTTTTAASPELPTDTTGADVSFAGPTPDETEVRDFSPRPWPNTVTVTSHQTATADGTTPLLRTPTTSTSGNVNLQNNPVSQIVAPFTIQQQQQSSAAPFKLCILGDVPYSPIEECMLPYTIGDRRQPEYPYGLRPSDCEILVHLGDVRDGSSFSSCDESMYMRIGQIFSKAAVPTFFVPGENGWLDCTNGDEAYAHWSRHLFRFNEQTGRPQLDPNRYEVRRSWIRRDEATIRSELFSIHMKDRRILLIGLSLPGQGRGYALETSVQGYFDLMEDNVRWIENLLADYQWADLQGVVLCGHSVGNDFFLEQLRRIVLTHSTKMFWFFRDAHQFKDDTVTVMPNQPRNLVSLATDDTITPTIATIDMESTSDPTRAMSYDRGCDCTTDHRPTRLLEPRDRCFRYCAHAYQACPACIGTITPNARMRWPGCDQRRFSDGSDSRGRYDVCSTGTPQCNGMFDRPNPHYIFQSSASSLTGPYETEIPDGRLRPDMSRYAR